MPKRQPTKQETKKVGGDRRLYTLEVHLIGGPVSEPFLDRNPVVARTIQIAGNQTLDHLHHAIFAAFDREEEHMYEFQIGGKKPHADKALRYGRTIRGMPLFLEPDSTISARRTPIGTLGLKTRSIFFYWFDFGDDWWHQIKVVAIEDSPPKGRFPRITERVGESPPQYPDFDEDDEED